MEEFRSPEGDENDTMRRRDKRYQDKGEEDNSRSMIEGGWSFLERRNGSTYIAE